MNSWGRYMALISGLHTQRERDTERHRDRERKKWRERIEGIDERMTLAQLLKYFASIQKALGLLPSIV